MTMNTTTTLIGAKGGVGTSTIAAVYALQLAQSGQTVRLTATHSGGVDDLACILGTLPPAPGDVIQIVDGLSLADHPEAGADHNVVDGGTDCFSDHSGTAVYVIVRNDYVSLRRALNAPQTTVGAILVTERGRALRRSDVADVLAFPVVAQLVVDPLIARASDAGLLARARTPRITLPHTEATVCR